MSLIHEAAQEWFINRTLFAASSYCGPSLQGRVPASFREALTGRGAILSAIGQSSLLLRSVVRRMVPIRQLDDNRPIGQPLELFEFHNESRAFRFHIQVRSHVHIQGNRH